MQQRDTRLTRCMRWFCAAVALAALSVATPQTTFAQSDSDRAQAKKHFKRGAEAFHQGEYPDAIQQFRRAYQLDPNAMALYNIAVAYGKLGNYREARKVAVEASREGGLPKGVKERNDARIAAYSTIVRADDVATDVATGAGEGDQEARAEATDAERDQDADEASDLSDPDVTTSPANEGLSALGWTGVGAVTLGGASLALAGWASLSVSSDEASLAESPPGTHAQRIARADGIEQKRQVGRVALYTGAALAAVGSGLLIYDLWSAGGDESGGPAMSLAPSFSRGDVALHLSLSY